VEQLLPINVKVLILKMASKCPQPILKQEVFLAELKGMRNIIQHMMLLAFIIPTWKI
jgi:hypothetical protein